MNQEYLEAGIRQLVEEFRAAGRPEMASQALDERRRGYVDSTVLAEPTVPVESITEIDIGDLTLRLYRPASPAPRPVLIYYHGGCFVSGNFETHDPQLRSIARQSGALVIAVDYRLAPEHTYPAAHDDCYRAAEWVHRHCGDWGGDPARISLGGDSAGGHLALITALRLRSATQWQPARLLLIYPMLDASGASDSYRTKGRDYLITARTLLSGFELYLEGTGAKRESPEISPIYRNDWRALPPTLVITAEHDPLRDEGRQLVEQLTAAGNKCEHHHFPGVIHGFFQLGGISASAREAVRLVAGQLV